MRTAAKVDANQPEIVNALRQIGCSVLLTHQLGKGAPDLVVGYRGVNFMLEVKDGNKPPSRRELTPDEVKFHDEWNGDIRIVESVEDAIGVVTND